MDADCREELQMSKCKCDTCDFLMEYKDGRVCILTDRKTDREVCEKYRLHKRYLDHNGSSRDDM